MFRFSVKQNADSIFPNPKPLLTTCFLSFFMEFRQEIKITKERVAVLIGKKGEIKKKIEAVTKTRLRVDSDEGDIYITGEDGLGVYTANEIISAIGRGFNPDYAMLLLKGDYVYEQINMNDFTKTKSSLQRLKGRVIGTDGKCRKLVEELTECYICVYGKTIGIIGETSNVVVAKRAVESLLRGSQHASVYRWLEKQRHNLKKRLLLGDEAGPKE